MLIVASTRGSCATAAALAATTPDNDEIPRPLSTQVVDGREDGMSVRWDATDCGLGLVIGIAAL